MACERPDLVGRSLSQWECPALARPLIAEGIVEDISASTVRRMLAAQPLKPWRQPRGLYPKHPRDATFDATIAALIDLSTRPLRADELGLARDEKTSLPPRPRPAPTLPAQPHHLPNRVAHEDKRAGALHRFAAVDPRSGKVSGPCDDRQRQRDFMACLAAGDVAGEGRIRTIHLVGDNVRTPHGKEGRQWLAHHPRFVRHFTPGHGSWMHHVEAGFSLLQRQRLRLVDCASTDQLRATLDPFSKEWHHPAHPLNWSTTSIAQIMAAAPALAA